jgi:hypothetical protein
LAVGKLVGSVVGLAVVGSAAVGLADGGGVVGETDGDVVRHVKVCEAAEPKSSPR